MKLIAFLMLVIICILCPPLLLLLFPLGIAGLPIIGAIWLFGSLLKGLTPKKEKVIVLVIDDCPKRLVLKGY